MNVKKQPDELRVKRRIFQVAARARGPVAGKSLV